MDNSLASASFGDQDAGSGPVYSSPNNGPVRGALHAITARNLNEIGAVAPDDKQFLRSWRRQLHECIQHQQARLVRFLIAGTGISGQTIMDADVVRRYNEILTKYSRPSWNAMNIHDIVFHTDLSSSNAEIEHDIGMSPSHLRDTMRRLTRMFVNSATAMCAAETRLEEKLVRFEAVVSRIHDLMFLEPTAALQQLDEPTRVYLDSVLEKINLEEDYVELMLNYKKFASLKSLLTLANFQKTVGPTCTICMTKEVNQATIPCGHTFCEDCCRAQMTSCYICRVQIRDKVRLYFS
jgi:hypothetical protein